VSAPGACSDTAGHATIPFFMGSHLDVMHDIVVGFTKSYEGDEESVPSDVRDVLL